MLRTVVFGSFLASCVFASIQGFGTGDSMSIGHLKEHFQNKIDIEKHSSMSDRKFYYFKVGDTNNDNYLDGVELFKMITEHAHSDGEDNIDSELVEIQVDQVLEDMDSNADGVVSFSEYSKKFE